MNFTLHGLQFYSLTSTINMSYRSSFISFSFSVSFAIALSASSLLALLCPLHFTSVTLRSVSLHLTLHSLLNITWIGGYAAARILSCSVSSHQLCVVLTSIGGQNSNLIERFDSSVVDWWSLVSFVVFINSKWRKWRSSCMNTNAIADRIQAERCVLPAPV